MDSFLTYMPFISVAVIAGLFIMALLNFSTLRKSMQVQSEAADEKFEDAKRGSRYILE